MNKEFLVNKSGSVTLNVTANRIDSYRMKEETTGTVRVYRDGKIGVAGALGEPDEAALTAQAEKALSLGIPYVCALDGALEKEEHHERVIVPEKELVPTMQTLLDRISEACPRFAVSNKIMLSRSFSEYRNSNGRHLVCSDNALTIALLFQSRGSGNLMDCFYECTGRNFDPDAVVADCRTLYDAFYTSADIEEGEWPVVLGVGDLFGTFFRNFIGEMYVSGASLVSGKLGERIFSEKLTFTDDRNPMTCPNARFFDTEGQFVPDFRVPFIERGVLRNVLTTKNTAAQLGLPVSGTSAASYDGVPSYGLSGLYVEPTAGKLCEIVSGKAIFVVMASGGDTTPDGHFATPVQCSFLLENGRLVGRLPELNISGDFYSLLGENYLGAVRGDPLPSEDATFCITGMKVTKE